MALVLVRKTNESVRIGKDIRVIVTSVRGKRATLAIVAPPGVEIVREELLKKDEANE